MEKQVEDSESYQGPLKTTTRPLERALAIGAILVSGCKPTLDSVGRQEAQDWTKEASRPAGAECAASLWERGLSTGEGHCSMLWGGGREQFPQRWVLLCCVIGTCPAAASPVTELPKELLPCGTLSLPHGG